MLQQISISDRHKRACIRIQNRGPESPITWSALDPLHLCFEVLAVPVLPCCPMLSTSALNYIRQATNFPKSVVWVLISLVSSFTSADINTVRNGQIDFTEISGQLPVTNSSQLSMKTAMLLIAKWLFPYCCSVSPNSLLINISFWFTNASFSRDFEPSQYNCKLKENAGIYFFMLQTNSTYLLSQDSRKSWF